MGADIENEEFDELDYSRFAERLGECLSALAQLLKLPGFGAGPATVGAELELFLVDSAARPLPCNQAIRAAVADPRVTMELNRCNLELNASPALLAGRPFAALGSELNLLLDRVADAASNHAGRVALTGILPTLRRADLGPDMMTDAPRYRALNSGLRRLRQAPFSIRIAGQDPLELASEDVGLEGANTSFQVHLRVAPFPLSDYVSAAAARFRRRWSRAAGTKVTRSAAIQNSGLPTVPNPMTSPKSIARLRRVRRARRHRIWR